MSLIAKTQAKLGALIVAGSLAGAAIAAQPAAIASAETNAGNSSAPTIVVVRSANNDDANLNGVVGRLRGNGFTVVSAPQPLTGDAADTLSVESFLHTIGGPIVLVADAPRDGSIGQVASDDAQVKTVVYVTHYESDSRSEALTCSFNGSTGPSLPYVGSIGFSAPVCSTGREAYDATTTASIAKAVQAVERATLAAGTPMR
jgi:hypothetical protein